MNKEIEIPFEVKDFELKKWENIVPEKMEFVMEYTIPEGMEAIIKDGKVIVRVKESKDDKIRKAALEGIEYLERNLGWDAIGDTDILDIKEYLENQKDILQERAQNITNNMIEDVFEHRIEGIQRELVEFLSNTIDASWGDIIKAAEFYAERIKNIIEKQKEQKPIEWSDNFEENIRNLLHEKLKWTSEDGNMSSTVFIDDKTLKDIINGIWFYVGKEALKYPNKEFNAAEWNEEDESAFEDLIWCIEQARKSAKDENDMGNIWYAENWLKERHKSLRPQPHWKPSEEQIHALWNLMHYAVNLSIWDKLEPQIESLYNDLKKL